MDEGQDEYDQFLDVSLGLAKRRKNGEDISADIERVAAWRDRAFPDKDDSILVLDVLRSVSITTKKRITIDPNRAWTIPEAPLDQMY
ncbi:hypothetical protein PRIPAC_83379 [Pristionchus pacificus]|uniref:Uncharacterized protein n=1 Tax=Pristionchus pacificus TaxID=54126 RepID=A0A2A6BV82_PRIPA|nr:hypothetical protein PRIPAC_83379 [Pristionchus pacificus]|eukprot:PDM69809.1 hypothetical protein PRIPAC_44905 [Pristionchus pacificus]